MISATFTEVKLEPITVEAKRDAAGAKILGEHVLELLFRNIARSVSAKGGQCDKSEPGRLKIPMNASVHVEVLKGDPVLRVGTLQERLEDVEILPRNTPLFCAIRDLEQDPILRALYAVVVPGSYGIHEGLLV